VPPRPPESGRGAWFPPPGTQGGGGGDEPFAWNGHDWRSFPREQRDFHLSHISVNFDRGGFMRDRNLYLPFDRLDELVDEGSLGLSLRHIIRSWEAPRLLGSSFPMPKPWPRQ